MSIAFKLSTLAIRTLAKPISVALKSQAKQHASFRKLCINIAQTTHRFDINMRMNLLGEKGLQHVRPLNESKAIDSGANFISESFLFGVAGGLIIFESWRSRRKELTRREGVSDAIEALQDEVEELKGLVERLQKAEVEPLPVIASRVQTSNKPGERTSLGKDTHAAATIRKPTDTAALHILQPRPGELVRQRVLEVRQGARNADL